MTIEITSLVNVVQTIDGRPIAPYATQQRALVTPAIAAAASSQAKTIYVTSFGSDSVKEAYQQVLTPVEVTALADAGTPVTASVLLVDPDTKQIYGQSDGVGGYSSFGGDSGATMIPVSYPGAVGSLVEV